jgi:hypothetical protein
MQVIGNSNGSNLHPGCATTGQPPGSSGITALVAARAAGTHCLQFGRSSTNNAHSFPDAHLTYIPLATDAIAYAIRGPGGSPAGSNISRTLTVATLKSIYTQTSTSCLAAFKPLLPQFGSETRKFFLENILGLGAGADVANFAGPGGLHPCVTDTDAAGNPLLENTGNLLTDDKQLEPYSISSWLAQTMKTVTDVHGVTLLGNIAGITSLTLNAGAPGIRPVFNVLPNVLVIGPSNSRTYFVNTNAGGPGPNTALLCQIPAATLIHFGLLPNPNCGDPSIKSDNGLGTDTVGPGE